jgi:hypothetical protein
MKKGAKIRLIGLLGLAALAVQNASGGSAVVWDGHGHVVSYHGSREDEAARRALELAHSHFGGQFRLLASTDLDGYGAVAIAAKGTGTVIGVALGKRSATEANALAIDHCLKAGGIAPKVVKAWKG